MSQGRLRKGVDKAVAYGVSCGNINLERDAALLAMLRYMADFIDAGDGETPPTRYVTPASFLAYAQALGLAPNTGAKQAAEPTRQNDASRGSHLTLLKDKYARAGGG